MNNFVRKVTMLFFSIAFITKCGNVYGQMEIMPLGDSITQGNVAGAQGPFSGYRDDLYNLLLNAGISFDFVGSLQEGNPPDPDHEGHGGFTAADIDIQIDTYLNTFNPNTSNMVLLHIGTNDIPNTPPSTVINNIGSIVDKIYQHNPSIIILLSGIIPRNDGNNSANETLNILINELASNRRNLGYNISYIGHYDVFINTPNWQTNLMSDAIHPNDVGYALMADIYFSAITTLLGDSPNVTDNFNRDELGPTWVAKSEFAIVNSELANTATVNVWDYLAVYIQETNPVEVSFKWGANADPSGISNGGVALRLDAPDTTANGFLLWRNGNNIDLWTIVNGGPGSDVDRVSANLPAPQAGDVFKVKLRTDGSGHHFDVFVNDQYDGTISAPLNGNSSNHYAGFLLQGNRNNNVDDFNFHKVIDDTPPAAVTDLTIFSVTSSFITLKWTAPGDDSTAGTASAYDIRYSTSEITDVNFSDAIQISNIPIPMSAGTIQTVNITTLEPATTYYFAMKSEDDEGFISQISNIVSAATTSSISFVDNFNRSELGTDWVTDPEFAIVDVGGGSAFNTIKTETSSQFILINGELTNTSVVEDWGFIAVYKKRKNPIEVSFQWGTNAISTGIASGGFALMLDAASPDASGYMLWRNGNFIDMWTLVNGGPGSSFPRVSATLPVPQAGDKMNVVLRQDESGNHFDLYINGQFDGTISDTEPTISNSDTLYAGVILHGNRDNNIDNFTIATPVGQPNTLIEISGNGQTGKVGTQLPDSLVVELGDEFGNPAPNVELKFDVIEGNGFVNGTHSNGDIRIEAESGAITSTMEVAFDAQASGGKYIWIPAELTDNSGFAIYSINIPTTGNYVIWGRTIAPQDRQDSFIIEFDGVISVVWDVEISQNWIWDQVNERNGADPLEVNLTAGLHSLKIRGRDEGTKIDKIIITSDMNYVPSGLESAPIVTNSFGRYAAYYTLGAIAGNNKVQVSVPGFTNVTPITFTATGTVDIAANILKISGDNQIAPVGTQLPNPFIVELRDQFGNLVGPNYPVKFDVITGNGVLANPDTVFTNVSSQAQNILTIATDTSVTQVKVTAPGYIGPDVIFKSIAEPGDPEILVVLAGDNQVWQAAQVLPESLNVKITDGLGSPKSGYPVTYEIKSGGGTLNGSQAIVTANTNASGILSVAWTLGSTLGAQNTVEVRSSFNGSPLNNSPYIFTATALSPINMSKVSGDNQTSNANQTLAQPLKVLVTADDGTTGVTGVEVTFTVTVGDANFGETSQTNAIKKNNVKSKNDIITSVSQITVLTDSIGMAKATLTLGPTPGITNTVQATASFGGNPLIGSPINFTATSVAPQDLERISQLNHDGTANLPLADSIKVRVRDALGQMLANYPVIFNVTLGGGQVNGISNLLEVLSDLNGVAKVEWRLGPAAGQSNNKLQATASYNEQPLNGSPIEFTASAEVGKADSLVKMSGDSLTNIIESTLTAPFIVKVTDASNNAIFNWPVTFTVEEGGGKINGKTVETIPTNINGLAEATLTLGSTAGTPANPFNNKVKVTADNGDPLNGSPIYFVASAVATDARNLELMSGESQDGQAGLPLSQKIQMKVTDVQHNPIIGHLVNFKVTTGGGTIDGQATSDTVKQIQTDDHGIAEVTWFLGGALGNNAQSLIVRADDGINNLIGSPRTIFANATVGPVDADVSLIVSDKTQLPADGQSKATITVAFTDKFGNPVSGKAVTINATGSNNFIIQPPDTTDNNGQAVGTISSTKAEIKSITARNVIDGFNLNTSINVEFSSIEPYIVELSAGNLQTVNVGTALDFPIEVIVKDMNRNPVPGVDVEFLVPDNGGGGFIKNTTSIPQNTLGKIAFVASTDSGGKASATWVLGENPGTNIAEARVNGLIGSPVVFTATGISATPINISLHSGATQEILIAGKNLPNPLGIKITDANGKPVWNVPIYFNVQLGGGTFSDQNSDTVSTDYRGIAQTIFTLGQTVGTNIVAASTPALSESITFSFESVPGLPSILEAVDDGGSSVVNSVYLISVKISDIYNNSIEGAHATFRVIEGGATIQSQDNSTDEFGVAKAQVRLPTTTANVVVKASSDDLPGFFKTFSIAVVSGGATAISEFDGNNQQGTVGRELVHSLEVLITDTFGNPASGGNVIWVATQGNGHLKEESSTSDSNGIAKNYFTLGNQTGLNEAWAINSSLNGNPIVFTATGISNNFPLFIGLNDTSVVEGNVLEFQVHASDDDGDTVTYEAQDLPSGASFDSGAATFRWIPGMQQSGQYLVTFKANDNQGGFDSKTITITVKNSNVPPVINSFTPTNLVLQYDKDHSQSIPFSVDATDTDGGSLSYTWLLFTDLNNNGTLVSTSNNFTFNIGSFSAGTYLISVEVSDGQDQVSMTWQIDIVTSVELSQFSAQFSGYDGVQISWVTSREIDNIGFNLLRSQSQNGVFQKLNKQVIESNSKGQYQFIDKDIKTGYRYFYMLEDVNINGSKSQHGPISLDINTPVTFEICQNFPNPFNAETKIRYKLPSSSNVVIKIFDVLGREVKTLLEARLEAGFHVSIWDATDNLGQTVSSGIYYYQISAGEFHQTLKMLLIK